MANIWKEYQVWMGLSLFCAIVGCGILVRDGFPRAPVGDLLNKSADEIERIAVFVKRLRRMRVVLFLLVAALICSLLALLNYMLQHRFLY